MFWVGLEPTLLFCVSRQTYQSHNLDDTVVDIIVLTRSPKSELDFTSLLISM